MWRILLLLVSLAGSGCSLFFSTPDVHVQDVNLIGVDSSGADLELHLTVTNANPIDLKLRGYQYELKVLALTAVKGSGRESFVLPSRSTTDLRLPLRVSFKDMFEIFRQKPNLDKIPYQLTAALEVGLPVGSMTIPLEKSGTFKVPERYRPAFFLKSLRELLPHTK